MKEYDSVFKAHIAEAEGKAKNSYQHQKWMMFGYWKNIAIHLRKLHRQIRSDLVHKSVGFPTRFEIPAIQRQAQEISELRAELQQRDETIFDLKNEVGTLRFDLNKAKHELSSVSSDYALTAKAILNRKTQASKP